MSVQPIDPKKPDLEESTNVAQQHADLANTSGAATREKQLRENGLEPVSIWIFIVGSIIALIAGSVLFQSSSLLNYNQFVQSNYARGEDPQKAPPVPSAEVQAFYTAKGQSLFGGCAGCHGSDGNGVAGAPPLSGAKWVTESPIIPGLAVMHGIKGNIDVAGTTYSGNMPAQGGTSMSDLDLAALIYYIQNNFGNEVGILYTPEQIGQIRKISSERSESGQLTSAELSKYLGKTLDGEGFTPGTIINKKTGEILEN